MAKDDWLPHREDEMLPWFNNFNTKLPGYAVTLDLSPDDLTTVADDSAMVEFAVNGVAIYKAEQKEWVDFKNLELYGPLGRPTPGLPTVPVLTPPSQGRNLLLQQLVHGLEPQRDEGLDQFHPAVQLSNVARCDPRLAFSPLALRSNTHDTSHSMAPCCLMALKTHHSWSRPP